MRVIEVRAICHTVKQRTVLPRCCEVGSVPADMGHFDSPTLQTSHLTAQDAQSRDPFGNFTESRRLSMLVAAVKQKLHAQANAQKRTARCDKASNRLILTRGAHIRHRIVKSTDTRHDGSAGLLDEGGVVGHEHLSTGGRQCPLDGKKVSLVVIDHSNVGRHARGSPSWRECRSHAGRARRPA